MTSREGRSGGSEHANAGGGEHAVDRDVVWLDRNVVAYLIIEHNCDNWREAWRRAKPGKRAVVVAAAPPEPIAPSAHRRGGNEDEICLRESARVLGPANGLRGAEAGRSALATARGNPLEGAALDGPWHERANPRGIERREKPARTGLGWS